MIEPDRADSTSTRAGGHGVTLAERVYDAVRARILKGEFPLGSPIPRRDLARELGTSLQPIADALRRLEHDGLVENINRVGSVVRVPRLQDIRGLFLMQEALETQAARLFSQKADFAQRRQLERMAAEFDVEYDECVNCENLHPERRWGLLPKHTQFHLAIAGWSGCPILRVEIERNHGVLGGHVWVRFKDLSNQLFRASAMPPGSHAALAAVLAAGDEEAADHAMRQHVRHGRQQTMECLEPYCLLDLSAPDDRTTAPPPA